MTSANTQTKVSLGLTQLLCGCCRNCWFTVFPLAMVAMVTGHFLPVVETEEAETSGKVWAARLTFTREGVVCSLGSSECGRFQTSSHNLLWRFSVIPQSNLTCQLITLCRRCLFCTYHSRPEDWFYITCLSVSVIISVNNTSVRWTACDIKRTGRFKSVCLAL